MEGVSFVGNDACAHNLLPKGRPLIMRLQQLLTHPMTQQSKRPLLLGSRQARTNVGHFAASSQRCRVRIRQATTESPNGKSASGSDRGMENYVQNACKEVHRKQEAQNSWRGQKPRGRASQKS